MKALLDTSTVIWLLRGDRSTRRAIGTFEAALISVITYGELLYGMLKSSRAIDHDIIQQRVLNELKLVNIEGETARLYAMIEHKLRSEGKPLADNDMWIAATAIEHDLTLLTFDHHFERVDGLKRVIL